MAEAVDVDGPARMAGGGPAGKAPLVRAVRAKSGEFRKAWADGSGALVHCCTV